MPPCRASVPSSHLLIVQSEYVLDWVILSVAGCNALQWPRAVAIGRGPMWFLFYRWVSPSAGREKGESLCAPLSFPVGCYQVIDVAPFVVLLL